MEIEELKNHKHTVRDTVSAVSIICICLYAMFSCVMSPLDKALSYAGDNRVELEKLIAHYSEYPEDSLKLRAAIFLIENMPGHFSFSGERINEYYSEVESILETDWESDVKKDGVKEVAKRYPGLERDFIEDIKIITADYLIWNIDRSFDEWQSRPWAEHLTFDQFCEYILPYKVAELQRLDFWRDTLANRFSNTFNSLHYNDNDRNSTYTASRFLHYKMGAEMNERLSEDMKYPFFNSSIYKMAFGSCDEYSVLATMVNRSLGVPASLESFPMWGHEGPGGHGWYSFLNNNGMRLMYRWVLGTDDAGPFFHTGLVPKIYRHTYSYNPDHEKYLSKTKYIYPLFPKYRFAVDITADYLSTSDLSIPVKTRGLEDSYVYLSVFDNDNWTPITFGAIKNGKALFKDIGRDMVYIVLGYDGNRLIPISDPFLLKANGDIRQLNPDTNNLTDIRLLRRYLLSWHVAAMEHRMVGGMIQASDYPDFTICETLYTIDSLYYPDMITISPKRPYRYWRYLSPDNGWGSIADLQFFGKDSTDLLTGVILGSEPEEGYGRENAFDGDYLTSFSSTLEDGAWIGMDMGKPVSVGSVRCIPCSDDNRIHFADRYELTMWVNGQWESLGIKDAQDNYLIWESVPDNALLLLTNLSRGRQRRIFTYQNDRQIFW